MKHHLLILGWHNVEGTWSFPARPGDGTRGLHRQLSCVRRLGNVVELGAALDELEAGRPLPPRAVALTFDDGYRDNLETALPMLQDLGLPATFFLIPRVLDGEIFPWWETLAHAFIRTEREVLEWSGARWSLVGGARHDATLEVTARLKQLDQAHRQVAVEELVDQLSPAGNPDRSGMFLDWDGARELAARGARIGAHSLDHAILSNETPDVQSRNLVAARAALEAGLDGEVDLLAYPNGTRNDINDDTVKAAVDAGFRCGVTTVPGWNDDCTPPFELRRQVMYPERDVAGFRPLLKRGLQELKTRAMSV